MQRSLTLGILPLLMGGCGGGADGFTFALVPRTLESQSPFADSPDVKLLVRHASGVDEIYPLGAAGTGETVELGELPDIAAGSTIGVIAQSPGGAEDQYDPSLLVAYGQVELETGLSTSEDDIALEVLILEAAVMGEVGTLSNKNAVVSPGVALIPGGDVLLFGGADEPFEQPGTNQILRMSQTDSGDWEFSAIDQKMPNVDIAAGLTGCSATTVMVDGSALVFVAGGRPGEEVTALDGGITQNSTGAWLFDPATEEVVWDSKRMTVGRSQHHALRLDNGKVLLYGGYRGFDGYSQPGSFELFDPEKKRFTFAETGAGDFYEAAASLGPDGAMICGGSDRFAEEPVSTCIQVSPSGDVGSADSLPEAVFGHAMVALGDGKILATGGVTTPTQANDTSPATDRAWLYNGSSWSPLDNVMALARARHVMIPTPEGKVLILGGVENAGPLYSFDGPAIQRSEVFDPETLQFELIGGSLSDAGAGANPGFATWPGEGAFVFAGYDDVGTPLSATYGFIGFGPDL